MKRAALFILILLTLGALYVLFADKLPGLADLKSNLDAFKAQVADRPFASAAIFFFAYVAITALSIPAAAIVTIGAGAVFGFWAALLLVSFASTLGALIAFSAARLLLHDVVQSRFATQLAPINTGLRKDGAFYLFTLRLIPAFPFVVVNLVMGLTPVSAWTFYWVSQIGMLPGTAVFVAAGKQLGTIESAGDVLSPGILAAFAAIGLFPWAAKAVLGFFKRRKVYAKWQKPKSFDRNLIVIGAGAAGLVSTYIAAASKAKVTLVEAGEMGGDCLNYGCVPSKALIRSAKAAHTIRHADRYGLTATTPTIPFRDVMRRVHEVIAKIAPHDSIERYEALGADVIKGYARIRDPWTVEITRPDGTVTTLTTRAIIIATGASPVVPPLPGIDETGYLTSDTLWEKLSDRDDPPRNLVVLGGGPIGCELSQSFARLGAQVTQIEMAPRLMIREDEEVSALVQKALETDGVHVMTGAKAVACEIINGTKTIIIERDGKHEKINFDELICAIGRKPRLDGFGLEELGIKTNRTIETNEWLETIYPNILAAGDVAGPYQFTHTAGHQAWFAAMNALFGDLKRFKADYRVIPWTTFTDPEIAHVGLNEQMAKEQNIAYEIVRYGIDDLDRAITDGTNYGFVKVLTVPGKSRILGVTIAGEHAGDLLAEFVLAMKHGLGLNKILGTIHTYPTLAEANKFAAGEWQRAHLSPKLLDVAEWFHRWRRGGKS